MEQVYYCEECQSWGAVPLPAPVTFPVMLPALTLEGNCLLADHARVSPWCARPMLTSEHVGQQLQG